MGLGFNDGFLPDERDSLRSFIVASMNEAMKGRGSAEGKTDMWIYGYMTACEDILERMDKDA